MIKTFHPITLFKNLLLITVLGSIPLMQAHSEAAIVWKGLEDPGLKDALFDSYQGRHFSAITRLQSAQKQGRIKQQPERAALVLGGLYLGYGFHQEAASLFEAFLEKDQPQNVRDQAWFYLGKTQYQRGRYEKALAAVSRIKGSLGVSLEPERNVMTGLLLLKLDRYKEAADYLRNVSKDSTWGDYAQYNLGVATFKLGQAEQSVAILDRLGERTGDTDEIKNLRDKANLVLGYGFLNDGKYEKAKQFLNRMYLTGRHSNTALLALGRTHSVENNYKESLIPWLQLIERDQSDPAVQDALMGVPMAFGKLNAYKQSLEYYEKAMRSFQTEIKKINKAAEAINSGKLTEGLIRAENGELEGGGAFTLDRVLDTPEGRYLWPIIASHEFRETLFNYAQLRLSLGKLELWSATVGTYDSLTASRRKIYKNRITNLQSQVLLASEKLQHHLQSMAFNELERRKKRLVGYFNEARFSVAQIYDFSAKKWGSKQ